MTYLCNICPAQKIRTKHKAVTINILTPVSDHITTSCFPKDRCKQTLKADGFPQCWYYLNQRDDFQFELWKYAPFSWKHVYSVITGLVHSPSTNLKKLLSSLGWCFVSLTESFEYIWNEGSRIRLTPRILIS